MAGEGFWTNRELNNSVAAFLQDLLQQLSPSRPRSEILAAAAISHFSRSPRFRLRSPNSRCHHLSPSRVESRVETREDGDQARADKKSSFRTRRKRGWNAVRYFHAHVLPMKNERKYQIRFSHPRFIPLSLSSRSSRTSLIPLSRLGERVINAGNTRT